VKDERSIPVGAFPDKLRYHIAALRARPSLILAKENGPLSGEPYFFLVAGVAETWGGQPLMTREAIVQHPCLGVAADVALGADA
jgi:hypothetical protein